MVHGMDHGSIPFNTIGGESRCRLYQIYRKEQVKAKNFKSDLKGGEGNDEVFL